MKQTFQLIEQTCAKSLKPLCITYIIGFILGTFLLDMDEFFMDDTYCDNARSHFDHTR